MTNELIIFTHNDADQLSCALNIEYAMPNVKKKYFYTNYANIPEIVQGIREHVEKNGNTHLLIADVSFSDNKEHLHALYDMGLKITHIDHHLYPEGFWDCFPNMKVHYSKEKSAGLLCNEYFGNAGKNENLDKLTKLIDVYDLWQEDHAWFSAAQDFNEFFWTWDNELLRKTIIERGFRLPENYKESVEAIHRVHAAALADYDSRKVIHRAGKVSLAFIDEYFNQVNLREMANGQEVVVGINSYGIVRVRTSKNAPYSTAQKNALRLMVTGTENVGHENAWTFRMKAQPNFENIMSEAKRVIAAIRSCLI